MARTRRRFLFRETDFKLDLVLFKVNGYCVHDLEIGVPAHVRQTRSSVRSTLDHSLDRADALLDRVQRVRTCLIIRA